MRATCIFIAESKMGPTFTVTRPNHCRRFCLGTAKDWSITSCRIVDLSQMAPSVNPRLAKVKVGHLVDNSFVERLEKSGYVAEAMKKSR
jgi:hypothetical protein